MGSDGPSKEMTWLKKLGMKVARIDFEEVQSIQRMEKKIHAAEPKHIVQGLIDQ